MYDLDPEYIGNNIKCEKCGRVFNVENPNLFPCPDCFAKISKRAVVCPHCGAPVNGTSALSASGWNLTEQTANVEGPAANVEEQTIFTLHPDPMYFCLDIILGVILIPVIIGIFMLISVYIKRHFTVYRVTNKRVIVNTGWLNKRQVEIWIKDMRGVNLQQDLWERIIGTGSVAIGTAATAGTEIHINGIRNPQVVVDKINSLRH